MSFTMGRSYGTNRGNRVPNYNANSQSMKTPGSSGKSSTSTSQKSTSKVLNISQERTNNTTTPNTPAGLPINPTNGIPTPTTPGSGSSTGSQRPVYPAIPNITTPGGTTQPGTSTRPGASTQPGTSTRPGASPQPGTSTQPGASTQPGTSTQPGGLFTPGTRTPGLSTPTAPGTGTPSTSPISGGMNTTPPSMPGGMIPRTNGMPGTMNPASPQTPMTPGTPSMPGGMNNRTNGIPAPTTPITSPILNQERPGTAPGGFPPYFYRSFPQGGPQNNMNNMPSYMNPGTQTPPTNSGGMGNSMPSPMPTPTPAPMPGAVTPPANMNGSAAPTPAPVPGVVTPPVNMNGPAAPIPSPMPGTATPAPMPTTNPNANRTPITPFSELGMMAGRTDSQSVFSTNTNPYVAPTGVPLFPLYGYDNTHDSEKDVLYLRHLYPRTAKLVQLEVDNEADHMEYDGSMMFDENPDKVSVEMIVDRIYDKIKDSVEESKVEAESIYLFTPDNTRNYLHDLVYVMFLNEMFNRRRRYRGRKRWY